MNHVHSDTLYHFPQFDMIYQIKLQYGFMVEAADQTAAYNKAAKLLRDNPGMAIASVHQSAGAKRKTSLLMRIIKGG